VGLQSADEEAGEAVQETGFEKICPEESPGGTQGDFEETRPPASPREVPGSPLRVTVELLEILRERTQGVVQQRRRKWRSRPRRAHVGVDALLGIARRAAPQKAHEPVLSPPGMADDAIREEVIAAQAVVV